MAGSPRTIALALAALVVGLLGGWWWRGERDRASSTDATAGSATTPAVREALGSAAEGSVVLAGAVWELAPVAPGATAAVDARRRAPVAGARVALVPRDRSAMLASALTDEHGAWRMELAQARLPALDELELVASAHEHFASLARWDDGIGSGTARRFEHVLPRSRSVSGRVVDDFGLALEDAAVVVRPLSPAVGGFLGEELRASTDRDGRYRVGLPADALDPTLRYEVVARDRATQCEGRALAHPWSAHDGALPTVLIDRSGWAVDGRVVCANGEGLAGVRMRARFRQDPVALTDADGRFRLAPFVPGTPLFVEPQLDLVFAPPVTAPSAHVAVPARGVELELALPLLAVRVVDDAERTVRPMLEARAWPAFERIPMPLRWMSDAPGQAVLAFPPGADVLELAAWSEDAPSVCVERPLGPCPTEVTLRLAPSR